MLYVYESNMSNIIMHIHVNIKQISLYPGDINLTKEYL